MPCFCVASAELAASGLSSTIFLCLCVISALCTTNHIPHQLINPPRSRRVDDNHSPHGSKLTHITPDTKTPYYDGHDDCVVASEAQWSVLVPLLVLPCCRTVLAVLAVLAVLYSLYYTRCTVRALPCCSVLYSTKTTLLLPYYLLPSTYITRTHGEPGTAVDPSKKQCPRRPTPTPAALPPSSPTPSSAP